MGIQLRQHGTSAAAFAIVAALGFSSGAHADITISTDATQNMNCSGGVCQPTATTAVLNANDLEGYLASGNVEVTTSGSGGVQANNIDIEAALSWSTASALSLVASQVIEIDRPVSVTGSGGLTLTNNGQNESLAFGEKGNVAFSNLSSSLTINGGAYTLVNTVKGLGSAIASNPNGDFAFAASYDAKGDGKYQGWPVYAIFYGQFDGLGNSISHLSMSIYLGPGLFGLTWSGSVLRNLRLRSVRAEGASSSGGLVSYNSGYISRCSVSGSVMGHQGNFSLVGGLAGTNSGKISQSYSTASVTASKNSSAGSLVGWNSGTIRTSFAMGRVNVTNQGGRNDFTRGGGLVGYKEGKVVNSYATGAVTGGQKSDVGGLVGFTSSPISTSYSIGKVTGAPYVGGFAGYDYLPGSLSHNYWDTQTSGVTKRSQGAGYPANDPGIKGLTTKQFQSGLPAGFDPTIWAENSSINNGFPYLIANPPPQ